MKVKSLSRVGLLATPWTAAYQAPPSMGFSRQEYWSEVHCLLLYGSLYLIPKNSLSFRFLRTLSQVRACYHMFPMSPVFSSVSSPAIRAALSGSHCPMHRLLSNTGKMSLETLAGHRGSPGKETALLADNEWTLRIWGREDSLGVVF